MISSPPGESSTFSRTRPRQLHVVVPPEYSAVPFEVDGETLGGHVFAIDDRGAGVFYATYIASTDRETIRGALDRPGAPRCLGLSEPVEGWTVVFDGSRDAAEYLARMLGVRTVYGYSDDSAERWEAAAFEGALLLSEGDGEREEHPGNEVDSFATTWDVPRAALSEMPRNGYEPITRPA